ncbi:hypothetical protein B566_EDAN006455, partial [Ephemera danica]
YSHLVTFLSPPSHTVTPSRCSHSAVIKIDFTPEYRAARVSLHFSKPRRWTFHMADTPEVEGYGQGNSSSEIEVHLVNRQLRVYGMPEDAEEAEVTKGSPRRLRRVLDGTVRTQDQVEFLISMHDEPSLTWHDGRLMQNLPPMKSQVQALYLAVNRALAGPWPSGSGLCAVNVTLLQSSDDCDAESECHAHAFCRPTRRAVQRCVCQPGWEGDGKVCRDIDECRIKNGGCAHTCINTPGSYHCECLRGFRSDSEDPHNCLDQDECSDVSLQQPRCQERCVNTVGSYHCACHDPLSTIDSEMPTRCIPMGTSCQERKCSHGCDESSRGGSAWCWCRRHHLLDAGNLSTCRPTCLAGNGGCQHRCLDESNGPVCTCAHKYLLGHDGRSCAPSCAVNNGGCQKRCSNTDVGVLCSCPAGFVLELDGKSCRGKPGGAGAKCEHICVNSIGSFECVCPTGYKLKPDEHTCHDVDECELSDLCDHECINTPGSFQCLCRSGYQQYGITHCGETKESPHYIMMAKMLVTGVPCLPEGNVTAFAAAVVSQIAGQRHLLPPHCSVSPSHAACEQSHKALKRVGLPRGAVTRVLIKLTAKPSTKSDCNEHSCVADDTLRSLQLALATLRKESNAGRITIIVHGRNITIIPKTVKAQKNYMTTCPRGRVKVGDMCVGCGVGSYYDDETGLCLACPSGSFQDNEGEMECTKCTDILDDTSCLGLCLPGTYSLDGTQPCTLCPSGTYQPQKGRISCKSCGRATSIFSGATTFEECTVKGTKCGSVMSELQGYVESPNYPGDYPGGTDCSWIIRPGKGRRLLIIVPELALADNEKCGDQLVMRKSKSAFSMVTYEACSSRASPLAITARSKNLWIQFRSDVNNSAQGFHIPFVTYNEEYQPLIEDIVQDSRLYASHNHREILKDRKLLDALMEVIAQPINYYKYANEQRNMFPGSFIRLMTPKVRRFFSHRRRRNAALPVDP